MEQKPHSNGSALEISLELPSDRKFDVKSILLGSPQQQKQSSSEEEEWLDVDTGQPPSVSKVCLRAYGAGMQASKHIRIMMKILQGFC